MTITINQEWRDQHRQARYPFVDGATLRSKTGLELPEGLFLDASLYPIGGVAGVYLRKVIISGNGITFVIGNNSDLASGEALFAGTNELVRLTDTLGRPAGVLVVDTLQLSTMASWTVGEHQFQQQATEFVGSVVVPVADTGVQSFVLPDGEVFTGDVWIIGTDGVVLHMENGAIRVDIVGDPLASQEVCEEHGIENRGWPLQTINGIPADEYGNFKFLPGNSAATDSILRIERAGNGLVLRLAGVRNK